MPSKKGMDQALTWLRSKANDKENVLDSINAELCINVIMALQRQCDKLGAHFGRLSSRKSTDEEQYGKQLNFLE